MESEEKKKVQTIPNCLGRSRERKSKEQLLREALCPMVQTTAEHWAKFDMQLLICIQNTPMQQRVKMMVFNTLFILR